MVGNFYITSDVVIVSKKGCQQSCQAPVQQLVCWLPTPRMEKGHSNISISVPLTSMYFHSNSANNHMHTKFVHSECN